MLTQIKRLARYIDSDSSGTISWDEFQSYITDSYVASHFHGLNLNITNAEMFFRDALRPDQARPRASQGLAYYLAHIAQGDAYYA